MLSRLTRRLTYANVVATMALFVALGGSAYAVNTVNSSDITDGEVKSVDIGDNEVKSADVKDQSLTTFDVSTFLGADIVDGTITGDDVADNTLGPSQINEQQLNFANTLTSNDLGPGSVGTSEVSDGSLKAADIAEHVFNFTGDMGTVAAHHCNFPSATGVAAQGDDLILTPDFNTANNQLSYTAEYRPDFDSIVIKVCNPTDGNIVDGLTTFNLLVISHS